MDNKLLTVSNLEKSFHTKEGEIKALKSVSFDVKNQEFISIVGPSGCGKSTILSILAGLEEKSKGDIKFDGNYTIGYMLQNDSLFEWRTVLDNCLLGLEITKQLTKENKDYGGIEINTEGRTVTVDEKPIELSLREYELLKYLLDNENVALSRDKILNNVWNYDYYGDSRTIDSHIKKIRHKLGKKGKYIKTIRGVGYKFEVK